MMKMLKEKLLSSGRRTTFTVVVVAACLFSAGGYSASRILAGSPTPAPGVANDVSALRTLPPAATVGPAVRNAVEATASRSGIRPSDALASLRELLPDVGRAHNQLYAFNGPNGGACFLLWQRMGTCPQSGQTFDQGVTWGVAGGYPTTNGEIPSAVLGIVSDDVSSVSLTANGKKTPLPIVHNAFFHELPDLPAGSPWDVKLTVTRSDGTTTPIVLPNPRQ